MWGDICGQEIVKFMKTKPALPASPKAAAEAEEKRVFGTVLGQSGPENPYAIREELRTLMDQHMGVYRDGAQMKEGMQKLATLRARFGRIGVSDKGRVYNSNLVNVLETENLLDLAEVMLTAALAREE